MDETEDKAYMVFTNDKRSIRIYKGGNELYSEKIFNVNEDLLKLNILIRRKIYIDPTFIKEVHYDPEFIDIILWDYR